MGYTFNFVTPDGREVGTNSATAASDFQYVMGYKPVAAKKASNPRPVPRPKAVEPVTETDSK